MSSTIETLERELGEAPELTTLVYRRRRQLYDAIDRLKAAEGKERRIKSRLMYVLPAERRRYLSGAVDEEFEDLLAAVREAYCDVLPGVRVSVVTERPGEVDLRGDATWRALERLYSGTLRRWVEIRSEANPAEAGRMARQISYFAGGHTPRTFVGREEVRAGTFRGPKELRPLSGYESEEGRICVGRI